MRPGAYFLRQSLIAVTSSESFSMFSVKLLTWMVMPAEAVKPENAFVARFGAHGDVTLLQ